MMRGPEVWPAMAAAYEATVGQGLTAALLAALDAAELAGGDLRGRQSAAVLIVPAAGTDADRIVDVRVDDSPEPLKELRRLVALNDAYVLADEGDALLAHEDMAGAAQRYIGAYEAAPDKVELVFWAALGLMSAGLADRGLVLLRDVVAQDERWLELLRRLDPATVPAQPEALRLLGR
jgi:uncharacterized Ntn-hydrolase superfamily protein